MPRGNPDNLRAAARRKHDAATERAETALDALVSRGDPITFRGLAKAGRVSIDFLYRSPLRPRIEQLRANQQRTPPAALRDPGPDQPPSQSNVVRTLTTQLSELKRHHRAELARLEAALAAAQGENLEIRRRLGRSAPVARPAELQPEPPDDALIEPAPAARGAAQ
jgi:hypothetical protein